jgi:hypothetical protein
LKAEHIPIDPHPARWRSPTSPFQGEVLASLLQPWSRIALSLLVIIIISAFLIAGLLDSALAQGGPFGMPRSQSPAVPVGGVLGWIFAKQAEFYRQFSGLIRAAKADGSAAWSLLALSFAYGIFHAAGPGHGKAVISSYLIANEQTWRRGLVLSFASALLQALVAIMLVGIALGEGARLPRDRADAASADRIERRCDAHLARVRASWPSRARPA